MSRPFAPQSRRAFLTRSAALPLVGGLSYPVRAETTDDYRAIVCVMLEGGLDNWSALVPYDDYNYAGYRAARTGIAIDRASVAATRLQPKNDLGDFAYALNPNLSRLAGLFHSGEVAVLQGIGALVEPTTRARVTAGTARLPPQMFSHNDQRAYVLSNLIEGANTGWGGRIADALSSRNGRREFTCINASDVNSIFLYGKSTLPYTIGPEGAVILLDGQSDVFGAAAADALKAVGTTGDTNLLRAEYAKLMRRALDASGTISSSFGAIGDDQVPELSDIENDLAMQLRTVARAIGSAKSMGMKRQVFFTSIRGFDAHTSTRTDQGELFGKLDSAMSGFQRLLQRWGMANAVTTFTATDFGRGLSSNGDGTDHGWGGIGFVMGGAVSGRRILGKTPLVGTETNDMALRGRLVPTIAVDQLAGSLALWMGVSTSDLPGIVPNIVNFDPKTWDLMLFGQPSDNNPT